MSVKLAIFDVDGTLFDGTLGVDLVKGLLKGQIITKEIGEEVFEWFRKYRQEEVSKKEAVGQMYKLVARGLAGVEEKRVQEAVGLTWNQVKSGVFDFVIPLISYLQSRNYRVVILSGSPIEMIARFGQSVGVSRDNLIAGVLEVKNGIYTGGIVGYPGGAEDKVRAINEFVRDNKITVDWNNSLAMGDNERDEGILRLVGRAYAFEPNEALKLVAEERGFKVVTREKVRAVIEGDVGMN